MIDVVFSDSAKAAMIIARRQRKESNGVAGLSFILDIGDLSAPPESEERARIIAEQWGHAFDGMEDPAFRKFIEGCRADLDRVRRAAREGEGLRVWHSQAPSEACGLCHLLWEVRNARCPVTEVVLPPVSEGESGAVERSGWSAASPEEMLRFLPRERGIAPEIRKALAMEWSKAVEENAPLRAAVSGHLVGVSEDFYDPLLRACLPEEPFSMALLIGRTLNRYPIGVGDWWYAGRIREMIRRGELIAMDAGDGDHPYSMTLRRG